MFKLLYIRKTKNKFIKMKKLLGILFLVGTLYSCKKTPEEITPEPAPIVTPDKIYPDTVWTPTGSGPRLIFKFKFD